jgi:hypothetical protein
MAPVVIHNKTFTTKLAATAYVRTLMAEIGVTTDLEKTHPEAYPFMLALVARHPRSSEKLDGMVRLEINHTTSSTPDKTVYGGWIHYADGTRDDVSLLNKCISGAESGDKLAASMRQAIDNQVLEFRASAGKPVCAVCGVSDTMMHVDHVIEFHQLAKKFMKGRTDVPTIFDPDPDGKTHQKFRQVDHVFKAAWEQYHKDHAKLQLACHKCNTSSLHSKTKKLPAIKRTVAKPVKPMFSFAQQK